MSKDEKKPPRKLIYTVRHRKTGEVLAHLRAPTRGRAATCAADRLLEIELADQETLLHIGPGDVEDVDEVPAEQAALPLGDEPDAAAGDAAASDAFLAGIEAKTDARAAEYAAHV